MATMAVRSQQSTSTLSNYSIYQDSGNDTYASSSHDFCNSFWGEGDEGANVLFTRMRNAIRTSEELQTFWTQRAAIEEEFGKRLAVLARIPVGADETGDLKLSLQALVIETQQQAESHIQLAFKIRQELIEPVVHFHDKQIERKRTAQAPIEKKLKAKQSQASYVSKAREKYEGDCLRIKTYKQQAGHLQGQDLERLQVKLRRALETVKANEKDYTSFSRGLSDLTTEWETEWKAFCDDCQDLEEERMEFTKDNVWNYANMISTACVNDDESCEKIRIALDQLEPDRDLSIFVELFGTGNRVADPPTFIANDGQKPLPASATSPTHRTVLYERVSRKPQAMYQNAPVQQPSQNASDNYVPVTPAVIQRTNTPTDVRVNGTNGPGPSRSVDGYNIPQPPPIPEESQRRPLRRGPSLRRHSQPLPAVPHGGSRVREPPTPLQPPVPVTEAGNRILFLVKALYDYKATIDEEFDFQAGDIIAVTETPDDGWWSGELLDEARKEPGRHIFPSNYVCLF